MFIYICNQIMRTRNTDKVELVKEKTIELIVQDGFEGFSLNKLAKACGISVATLYIYYKDRDDLILQIGQEAAKKWNEVMLKDFDPGLSFEEGLRIQWKNRCEFSLQHPLTMRFFEQLRNSTYQQKIMETMMADFKEAMGAFVKNAINRREIIKELTPEIFWSIAYSPLYNLINFHNQKQNISGMPFELTDEIVWRTFDLVIKALKPTN